MAEHTNARTNQAERHLSDKGQLCKRVNQKIQDAKVQGEAIVVDKNRAMTVGVQLCSIAESLDVDATYLVVGMDGDAAFVEGNGKNAVLGSVSDYIAKKSRCISVIVR